MAVPKKRTSRSRRDLRRSHDALRRSYTIVCSNCDERQLRHRVCPSCGFYRGKSIISIKSAVGADAPQA